MDPSRSGITLANIINDSIIKANYVFNLYIVCEL